MKTSSKIVIAMVIIGIVDVGFLIAATCVNENKHLFSSFIGAFATLLVIVFMLHPFYSIIKDKEANESRITRVDYQSTSQARPVEPNLYTTHDGKIIEA